VSLKKAHISFLTLTFSFFVLVISVFGYGFSKDNGLILNYSTSDSVPTLGKSSSQSHLFSSIFLVRKDDQEKFSYIPILGSQNPSEFDQRFSFHQWNYSKTGNLSSPPAVFDPKASFDTKSQDEVQTRRARSSTYPIMKSRISYRKASIIGGLNLVAVTAGFHKAVNAWGESNGRFHIKDDWKGDGLAQTDELSHFMWGYKMTQFLSCAYDWVGFSPKTSQALSSSESALILTLVEYPIDAYNPKQGLGVSDLVFDYVGVGLAVAKKHCSWLNDFDFKISWKKNIFSQNKTPFAQTYEEYDNFIYWLTYRTELFLPKKLLCFGFGYSVTHLEFKPKREFYGGIGLSIPDFVSLFGKKLGDKSRFLEILYPNIRIKL
jgi:hypothetical protein